MGHLFVAVLILKNKLADDKLIFENGASIIHACSICFRGQGDIIIGRCISPTCMYNKY
jgi:hypothetical protein